MKGVYHNTDTLSVISLPKPCIVRPSLGSEFIHEV